MTPGAANTGPELRFGPEPLGLGLGFWDPGGSAVCVCSDPQAPLRPGDPGFCPADGINVWFLREVRKHVISHFV